MAVLCSKRIAERKGAKWLGPYVVAKVTTKGYVLKKGNKTLKTAVNPKYVKKSNHVKNENKFR